MKFNTVLFDLDGTLTDSFPGIADCVEYALSRFGIKVENRASLSVFVGPPLLYSFKKFYGFSESDARRAVEYYRELFRESGIYNNTLYDGVVELLSSLKESGVKLLVATSKPEVFARKILASHEIDGLFGFIGGATLTDERTSKEQVIDYVIKSCGTDKSSALMVGDREHDITGAHLCGIKAAGVLYGYGSRGELEFAGADFIAETPEDIKNIIL